MLMIIIIIIVVIVVVAAVVVIVIATPYTTQTCSIIELSVNAILSLLTFP